MATSDEHLTTNDIKSEHRQIHYKLVDTVSPSKTLVSTSLLLKFRKGNIDCKTKMFSSDKKTIDFKDSPHISIHEGSLSGKIEYQEDKPDFSGIDHKKLLRKMDSRIIPGITILFLLSFVDRGNIGNAKIEGLVTDLKLHGNEWNIILTVFYFTYCAFEVPSNILITKFRPSIMLPATMILWGIVITLTSLVQNYHQLIVLRLLLGMTEAALYPGVVFYLTKWYTKKDLQFRQAMFFAGASAAGAFSGLLAYGISFMNGIAGLKGWRWIFIIEGLFTVVVAVCILFITYDYPETAKFLAEEERAYIIYRLSHDFDEDIPIDPQIAEEVYNRKDKVALKAALKAAFTDWQLPCHILVHWSIITTLYTVSFFLPSITKSMGYTNADAQLMTVPPYIAAVFSSMTAAYLSDRYNLRSPFIVFFQIVMIIGYIAALAIDIEKNPGGVYAGMFLAVVGSYSAMPGMISWLAINLSGPYKRSIGIAAHIAFGNMGSTFATNYFRTKDAPRYRLGYGMSIMFILLGTCSLSFINYRYYLINKRKKKDLAERLYDNIDPREILEMGDRSPYFLYNH